MGLFSVSAGTLLVGVACSWFLPARARRPEAVFVRTNDVMARYKVAIQARESFQKQTAEWSEEARSLEDKLRELAKTVKPSDTKGIEQARQLSSRLKALRDKGAARDQELMSPVLAEVNSGIKRFADKNGYRLVIGTLQGGVVLHGDESLDVTEALIKDLNQ